MCALLLTIHFCVDVPRMAGIAVNFPLSCSGRSVDFYRKIPNDLTEATLAGALISLVAALTIILLLAAVRSRLGLGLCVRHACTGQLQL